MYKRIMGIIRGLRDEQNAVTPANSLDNFLWEWGTLKLDSIISGVPVREVSLLL